jgi:hypothetical protein
VNAVAPGFPAGRRDDVHANAFGGEAGERAAAPERFVVGVRQHGE